MPRRASLCGASDGTARADFPRELTRAKLVGAAIFVGVASGVVLVGRAFGGYEVSGWAPLGIVVVSAAALLFAVGGTPPRLVLGAAGFLIASGVWSVLSVTWGGLPDEAWTTFDQSVLAAAALLCGSFLSSARLRPLVGLAVLAGIAILAAEALVRLALDAYPDEWLYDRSLEGPVSDHNAQAALFALALPIAVWQIGRGGPLLRFLSGGASALLVGGVLLTQSRGTIIALALALLVQLAWARSVHMLLAASLVAGAGIALFFPLRDVDAALVTGNAAEQASAFRDYALWTGLAALVVGALAAPRLSRRAARPLAAGLAAALLAGTIVFSVVERDSLDRARSAVLELGSNEPLRADPGATRFGRFTLSGRRDAWRISREMVAEEPLLGAGEGQFAPRWALDRRVTGIYIIQPHSLQLELLGELGAVGLALFVGFAALAVLALARGPDRWASAAALGALIVLLARASIDFTWSFPGLVAPTLLLVGAAGPPSSWQRLRSGRRSVVAPLAAGVLAVGGLAAFGAPYLADRELARAAELASVDPDSAWDHAVSAHRLNPWEPEIVVAQAQLAEAAGEFRLAAEHFRRAADLSYFPWLEHFRAAGALEQANALAASRAACRRAIRLNPGEQLVRSGPCADDLLVSSAPDRSEPRPLDGATVTGTIYVFATADDDVGEVRFFLDDPRRTGEPVTIERFPPYDLARGSENVRSLPGEAKPFDTRGLTDGEHRITVVIGDSEDAPRVVSATFTVTNVRAP